MAWRRPRDKPLSGPMITDAYMRSLSLNELTWNNPSQWWPGSILHKLICDDGSKHGEILSSKCRRNLQFCYTNDTSSGQACSCTHIWRTDPTRTPGNFICDRSTSAFGVFCEKFKYQYFAATENRGLSNQRTRDVNMLCAKPDAMRCMRNWKFRMP